MSDQVLQGEIIAASNGALRDSVTGKFVKGGKVTTAITKETSVAFHRRRVEKTQQYIRAALRNNTPGAKNSPMAVAIAAGDIWRDGVLNPEERLDDRRKAWHQISSDAGLLPNRAEKAQNDGVTIHIPDDIIEKLGQFLAGNGAK